MRVLLISEEAPPGPTGGIGMFYADFATALERAGAKVRLLTPEAAASPGRTAALARRWKLYREARRAVRDFQPDVVETHDWSGPLQATLGRPLVVRMHGAHGALRPTPSRFWCALERRTLLCADAHLAVSTWIARRTAHRFHLPGRATVVPSGIDTDFFRPPETPHNAAEILFVGSPRLDKGLPELFAATEQVFTSRPWATLTVVGALETGLPCAVPRSIRDRVRCLGRVERERLPELYGRATAAVFPSYAEAFGLAALEAASCGTAVAASRRGGASEWLNHGRNGVLIDPHNAPALAQELGHLLDHPNRRRALGEAARRSVVERFDLAAATQTNLEHYEELRSRWELIQPRAAA